MNELSVTITVGEGSELHNHDLEYRSTLAHVHDRPEGVIELIPYRPYQEQINEALKPYIDAYNADVDARYQAAWDRYNAGLIKTKPRKRDYEKMGYDYYLEHIDDKVRNPRTGKVEELPMWRSMIIGIGDQADRQAGRISESQAKTILGALVEQFREEFPAFLLLGASLHLDEQGFYHMHLDYKPLYEKSDNARGLAVGVGQDAALQHMGFEPEQSIINGRDKAPILFNAMRNKLYLMLEKAMADENLRLQYGITAVKEPGKDSSRNQALENWQATQDAARQLQHQKNIILDNLESQVYYPEDLKVVYTAGAAIGDIMDEIDKSPRSRLDKNNVVVPFKLLDQLKTFVDQLITFVAELVKDRNYWRDAYYDLAEKKHAAFGLQVEIAEEKGKLSLAERLRQTQKKEKEKEPDK